MKVKIFTMADPATHESEFEKWQQSNPGMRIVSKHICAHNVPPALEPQKIFSHYDNVYVYYETKDDVQYASDRDTLSENAALEMCKDIAKTVYLNTKEMEIYKGLKNATQRRAYMMEEHNIPAKDADLVHELIQMMQSGAIRAPVSEK